MKISEPLKELKTDLETLDQLRYEHGLEPMEELLMVIPTCL